MIEHFAQKDVTCKLCGNPFATSDGIDIFFGGVKVPGRPIKLSFTCPWCNNIIHWRRKMIEDRIYHVYPLNDKKQHTTGLTEYCACQPVIERSGREVHVHHNSFDGREFFEETVTKTITNKKSA